MAAILARGEAKLPSPKAKPTEISTGQAKELVARRSFFQTGFGTLAILPKAATEEVAKRTGTFLVMQPNMSCTVGVTRNPVWLQFNHHAHDASGERRHVGVLIIVHSKTAGHKKVGVYRNPGWTRRDRTEILGEFSKCLDLSWKQFAAISHKAGSADAKLKDIDDAFGGPWHAAPRGSDKYSWSYRQFWDWAVSRYEMLKETTGGLTQGDQFRVSARLIAYTPTPRLASDKPVVFDVNASQGDSVFIAVYSLFKNGQDTQSWYWLQLR
jgi:hypothetical protein